MGSLAVFVLSFAASFAVGYWLHRRRYRVRRTWQRREAAEWEAARDKTTERWLEGLRANQEAWNAHRAEVAESLVANTRHPMYQYAARLAAQSWQAHYTLQRSYDMLAFTTVACAYMRRGTCYAG